jgi:hypothetical protein
LKSTDDHIIGGDIDSGRTLGASAGRVIRPAFESLLKGEKMRTSYVLGSTVMLALVLIIGGSAVIAQEEMCVPMGDITIAPLTEEPQRSAVNFPHAVHFTYNCQQCHHTWNGQELITGCSASGCHDLEKSPVDSAGKPVSDPNQLIRYYKNAYHQMCIGCHKEIAAYNQKVEATRTGGRTLVPNGPTGCRECHPK